MSTRRAAFQAAGTAATIAATLLASLPGCTRSHDQGPAGAGAAPHAAILVRGGGPDPDSLDPQKARGFEAQSIVRDLCEGLTTLDSHAAVAPGVATTWGVSTDGKIYVFKLRREARWSNGEPVVAADFVAGLQRLVDPATASGYAQYIDVIANASDIVAGRKPPQALGVAAPDDSTVVVTLATPAPYLPTLLSHPSACPVHRPTLAAHPEGLARPGVMVGNGAFVLKEWVQGSYILASRNRYYWNNAATRLAAVKYLLIPDENAELTRYRGGELQVTFVVPRGQFDWIKANLADQLHVSPQLTTYYYGFNLRRAPFKDKPKLRRALSLAIDREKLAQLVLRVGELPAYGWVPPGIDNYSAQSFDYRGDVEMFRSSWVGDYNDAYTFAQYLKSDFGVNLPHYESAAYDALLKRAAAETDAGRRRALLEEAERLMLRDHPLMPLYFYVNKHLVKPEVAGWYDNVMNVVYSKDLALKGSAAAA